MQRLTIPTPELVPTDLIQLRAGMFPSYRRVWSGGVDVTDRPEVWPDRVKIQYANGWRPLIGLDGTFME